MVVGYYSGLGLPFSSDAALVQERMDHAGDDAQNRRRGDCTLRPITGYEADRHADSFPEYSALGRGRDGDPAKVVKVRKLRISKKAVLRIYVLGYMLHARTLPWYRTMRRTQSRIRGGSWCSVCRTGCTGSCCSCFRRRGNR